MYQESPINDLLMMSDSAIVGSIGKFIKHERLRKNKTQEELALESGIKRKTLVRLENGKTFNILTLVQILRHLDLLENIMRVFEINNMISPIQFEKMQKKLRKRARHSKTKIK